MPQHRLRSQTDSPRPTQNEFPVWYFFYDTLAQYYVLSGLLGTIPVYHDAKICGAVLQNWGKYKALVDDPSGRNMIRGRAFLVKDKDQEGTLRVYETEAYEVVRCKIEMKEGRVMDGLIFRFVGEIT